MNSLQAMMRDLASQWRASPRLRVAVFVAILVAWLHAVDQGVNWIDGQRKSAAELKDRLEAQRKLARQSGWVQRRADVVQARQALHALLWSEPERGIAEAAMQDWLVGLASRAGLKVRESATVRPDAVLGDPAGRAAETPAAPPVLPAGYAPMRARIVAEFTPLAASVLLAELAQSERASRVERMKISTLTTPATIELEVSSVVRLVKGEGQ